MVRWLPIIAGVAIASVAAAKGDRSGGMRAIELQMQNLRRQQEEWLARASLRPAANLVPLLAEQGDEMDPLITVMSVGVTRILDDPNTSDPGFLRGLISRSDGSVASQIYATVFKHSSRPIYIETFSYSSGQHLRHGKTTFIDQRVFGCSRTGCTYYIDVGIPLDIDDVREIASRCSSGQIGTPLKYRLYLSTGEREDSLIPCNEVAAFKMKLDEVSSRY